MSSFINIPYGKHDITESDIDAVITTLKSDFLTQGPQIEEFEKLFSNYVGSKYAVAVSNGTAALHLCALALGVNDKSNVISTPITFVATTNCVRYCNGNVYFSDINPQTYTLDLQKLENLINSKPEGFFSGIIPVDFAGLAVDMEKLRTIANKYDLWIIEDACHAPGAYFLDSKRNKQLCGNSIFSDLTIFSFHPVKHIACGEGGMITTNNEILFNKLIKLRTHGITKNSELLMENHGGWYYEMQELGFNYRMTDFQASLGISQLNRAEEGINTRRKIALKYHNFFLDKSYILGHSEFVEGHAYHLYVIHVERRNELYEFLKTKGIFTQVHYFPVHLMPYYKNLGWAKGDFPESENYFQSCLSIPIFPTLKDSEQDYVLETINSFFESRLYS